MGYNMVMVSKEEYRQQLMQLDKELKNYLPKTSEEYMGLVRQLGAIASDAMDYVEAHPSVSAQDRAMSLTRIADVVETIGALRGDTLIFENARAEGLESFQKEMYRIEDATRYRLVEKLGYRYPTQHTD